MPRRPTELDMIEHHLQAAARTIRDTKPGNLETERLRSEIYKHVYEAIEICARYAWASSGRGDSSARTTSPLDTRAPRSSPTSPSEGVGRGGGGDLAADLDFLKE